MSLRRLRPVLLLVALSAAVLVVYAPGLRGPFVFDDYPNIVHNKLVSVDALDAERLRDAAFSLGNRPYPHRGLARLSFALNYYFAGERFDRLAFKLTNLVIHLLNGLLVYWLTVLVLRRYVGGVRPPSAEAGWSAMQSYLPLVVTALWVLHPIQLTSVLYVVQRMTSLSALFVFAGLVVFVLGRVRLESGRGQGLVWMAAGLGGGVVLGFLCKQNAVLLPFYAFLVELFFFRRESLSETAKRRLYGFYGVTVALPALAAVLGLVLAWDHIAEGYLHRSFTPFERLLSQSRILFFYLGLIFFPHIRAFGLYHDDIPASTGWLEPWTTALAMGAWVVLIVLALAGVRRRSLWSFGLLWYLVGHALESSAGFYLVWALNRLVNARRLVYPVVGLLVAVLAFTTFTRAGIWGNKITLNLFTAQNHPESYRSLTGEGYVRIVDRRDARETFVVYQRAARARSDTLVPLLEMAKIVAGLRALVEANPAITGPEPIPPGEPAPLGAPLLISADYLQALEGSLDREIRRRLEGYPATSETVLGLDRLRDCVESRIDVCLPLAAKLEDWYRITLDNPRMMREDRAMLQFSRGKLYVHGGDMESATDYMTRAMATDPLNLSYPLALGVHHIQLEQWSQVAEILRVMEARRSWSGFGSRHIRWLRERYDESRQASVESRP
jgi:hypothetical protein